MKNLTCILFAVAALLAAGTIRADEALVSDYVYIARDANDTPPVQMPRALKALPSLGAAKAISVVGFINTGVTTNIEGVAYRQFMGYTSANFDASLWSIYYKWGTGLNQNLYTVAPHEETVNVSPLTIGSRTYEYCYRTIFYLPASASSACAVAYAEPPQEDTVADTYKNQGKVFTRRGKMTQYDYVMTDYDSTETEYYKVNTATTLSPTGSVGSISYINMNTVTPMEEVGEGGYVVQEDAKFNNVSITGTITYKGQNLMTNIAEMVENAAMRSGGGVWDSALQVYWTPKMENGSLTYYATTNVNINTNN